MKTPTTIYLFILTLFVSCDTPTKQNLSNATSNLITKNSSDTIFSADTLNAITQKGANKIKLNPFPEYDSLYNYGKMNDTVIYSVGHLDLNGKFIESKIPGWYFGKREITVINGKLKEVFMVDTNIGWVMTLTYGEDGLIDFENKNEGATNAPHFQLK